MAIAAHRTLTIRPHEKAHLKFCNTPREIVGEAAVSRHGQYSSWQCAAELRHVTLNNASVIEKSMPNVKNTSKPSARHFQFGPYPARGRRNHSDRCTAAPTWIFREVSFHRPM